jgi:hypothetical protein
MHETGLLFARQFSGANFSRSATVERLKKLLSESMLDVSRLQEMPGKTF